MSELVSKCCQSGFHKENRGYYKLNICDSCKEPCSTEPKKEEKVLSQTEIDLLMEQEIYKGLIEYLKKMFKRNPKEYGLMLKDDSEMGLIGLGAIYENPKKDVPPLSEDEFVKEKMKEFDEKFCDIGDKIRSGFHSDNPFMVRIKEWLSTTLRDAVRRK